MTSAGPKYSIIPVRALDMKLSHRDLQVLAALGAYTNKYGVCWPTQETIGNRVGGMKHDVVSVAIKALCRRKLVRKLKSNYRRGVKKFNRYQVLYDGADQPLPTKEEIDTPIGETRRPEDMADNNDRESEGVDARTREHICRKWSRIVEESTGYGVVWEDQLEHAERAMRADISMEVIEADTKAYIARKKSVPPSLIACISDRIAP